MPHLSPINWIMFVTFLWLSFSMILMLMFYSQNLKFLKPQKYSNKSISYKWKWLQDGWDTKQ